MSPTGDGWPMLLLLILIAALAPAYASEAEVELEPGVFHSSERCGECHQEIHAMWRRSLHSAATSDPVFEASYLRAYRETQGRARRVCLRCHAPVAAHLADFEMRQPVSREGITCDYCHSVVSVDLEDRDDPVEVRLDGVKRGPLTGAVSPAHAVEESKLHRKSEFCAGCHEYVNEHGVGVFTTYTEWLHSPQAAEGKTCQHCHMPMTPGETVAAPRERGRGQINLHNISGGHSSEQVRKAATVRLLDVRREGASARVDVEVANVGSGHSIPTGMPTRELILEVSFYVGDRLQRRLERRYAKTLLDGQGRLIKLDHRAVLAARSIGADSRLRPGERRVERLSTELPPGGPVRVEAALRYLYEPEILQRQRMSIDMASDRRWLDRR